MLFEMKLLIVPDRISFRLLYAREFSRTFRTLRNALKHHLQPCTLKHLDFRAHSRIVRLRRKKRYNVDAALKNQFVRKIQREIRRSVSPFNEPTRGPFSFFALQPLQSFHCYCNRVILTESFL